MLLQPRSLRSEAGQEDGQQDEAVEHSVADCQAKYLEKREEDVRGGEGEDDDSKKCCHPGIGDG